MSFTPGPWFAEMDGKHWAVRAFLDCHSPNKFKTFELCRILGNREDGEGNATAISQVPAMVEWIKEMREAIVEGNSNVITVLLTTGRALLHRIEGDTDHE